MQRRTLITAAAAGAFGWALPCAHAEVANLNDAINKAGRQRMLSQRMAKAWLALLQGVDPGNAQMVLDKSMLLFERQLAELKTFAPNAEIQGTYGKLDAVWSDYKSALVSATPARSAAASLLQIDARVLSLAHQGTQQYEAAQAKPVGKLVNIAGRQRMLSQRMAKFYLASTLPVDAGTATAEINKARDEFTKAMAVLRNAPEATPRIRNELELADAQWVFFDMALQKMRDGYSPGKSLTEVFVSSENLLAVMDRVTGMYSALQG